MAARLRREEILPALAAGEEIEIDFDGISLATQSFIHALISEAIRVHGEQALDLMTFKNCGIAPKGIIETVVQYVMETLES
ncbi:MAG: STAS-like domain-containing protein [Gloeomargaritaceae cyanobacterium C42_A2020_066]|nr:STAS-like domain-containing protein [Gloeomargaritaceae cyanobacterium C42_A2020_066]